MVLILDVNGKPQKKYKFFFRGPATKRGGGWPLGKKPFFKTLKEIYPKNDPDPTYKKKTGSGSDRIRPDSTVSATLKFNDKKVNVVVS